MKSGAWWVRVNAGYCGRCGVPYQTVPLGGWKNTCDPCHAIRQAQTNRWFVAAVVLFGLGVVITAIGSML